MNKLIVGACALVLCLGCEKAAETTSTDKASAAKKAPAETSANANSKKAPMKADAPPAAANDWIKLDKLGVQLEMPAGSKASPGAGDSFMISTAKGGCTVMLSRSGLAPLPGYDSTVKQIEKGITGKLKKMILNEKKDDRNWVIQFEREGMMDPTKSKFGVDVRSVIGDGEYSCSRVTNTPADAACILKACKSLKAL